MFGVVTGLNSSFVKLPDNAKDAKDILKFRKDTLLKTIQELGKEANVSQNTLKKLNVEITGAFDFFADGVRKNTILLSLIHCLDFKVDFDVTTLEEFYNKLENKAFAQQVMDKICTIFEWPKFKASRLSNYRKNV